MFLNINKYVAFGREEEKLMDETGEADVTDLGTIAAPWGKEILVQALHFRSGLTLARLRIREGRRFTVLDVDEPTATALSALLSKPFKGGAP